MSGDLQSNIRGNTAIILFEFRKSTIESALDSVDTDLIRKNFRQDREYVKGYREGFAAGLELEQAVILYKSYRQVSVLES